MEDQDLGEGHDIGLITAIHLVQIAHLLSSLLLYYSHLHAALDETICQSRGNFYLQYQCQNLCFCVGINVNSSVDNI